MVSVIALAIGIGAMTILAAGMILEYVAEMGRTEQVRSAADAIQERKHREDIRARFNGSGIDVESVWAGTTRITGIVVICDGGAVRTSSMDHVVPAGKSVHLDAEGVVSAVRGSCP